MEKDGGNNRRIKPGIRERIRERASSGGGGVSRGSSGNSSGSGGNDSGNDAGIIDADANTGTAERGSIADPSGSENRTSGIADGLRIVTRNSDRGNHSGTGNNGRDNRTSGNDNRDSGETAELFSENPSLIRVHEIIDAESPKGKRGRKPGTKNAGNKKTIRISTTSPDYSELVIPLKIAFDFVFHLPVVIGWGKHWDLSDEENDEISTCVKDVLEAFPSENTKQFILAFEKYVSLLTLGITIFGIMKPRMLLTAAIVKEKKALAKVEQAEKRGTAIPINNYREQAIG